MHHTAMSVTSWAHLQVQQGGGDTACGKGEEVCCGCAGADAGTPVAAQVLAEAAAEGARIGGASPGQPTPARTASPAAAVKTPGSALIRAAQAWLLPG